MNRLTDFSITLYISDGHAAQYKNQNNFLNLTLCQEAFRLLFPSTSPGQSISDSLGEPLKGPITQANLQ
jgi:hypothetical protein